jgi:plastocyanin
MRFRRAVPTFAILAALGLAACGDDDSDTTATQGEGAANPPAETREQGNAPAPSGEAVRAAKVEIEGFEFVPSAVTIQEGGKVIWINRDSTEHTATLDDGSFDSGALAEGKLKSESFKQPGTYAYHCELHPGMTGTVEVVAAG